MSERYRIESKGNVHFCGKKTSYKIYEYDSEKGGYVYLAQRFAPGFDATDDSCIEDHVREEEEEGNGEADNSWG